MIIHTKQTSSTSTAYIIKYILPDYMLMKYYNIYPTISADIIRQNILNHNIFIN